MILGDSGSGKSTSLRNFEPDEIGIFNVASKPLPFRKKLLKVDGAGYGKIIKGLSSPKLNAYAIDDSQYLLAFEFFDRAKENGYNKFTDIALNFRNLIQFVITQTPPDCIFNIKDLLIVAIFVSNSHFLSLPACGLDLSALH